jgi:hypothetical protein
VKHTLWAMLVLSLLTLRAAPLFAARDAAWTPFLFLAGDWVGEGGGDPGQGTGKFSFKFELQDQTFIRKNSANYPATKERPAYSHEDLMVIYREQPSGTFRADYYDSEGHVIRYTVTAPDAKTVQFVSDASAPGPRFRLTYKITEKDKVSIRFEIAPPGKPEAFASYIEAMARKLL